METKLTLSFAPPDGAARDRPEGLAPEERAVLALLRARMSGGDVAQPKRRTSLRGARKATKQSREAPTLILPRKRGREGRGWMASLRSQ